jgi:hypothetical protein
MQQICGVYPCTKYEYVQWTAAYSPVKMMLSNSPELLFIVVQGSEGGVKLICLIMCCRCEEKRHLQLYIYHSDTFLHIILASNPKKLTHLLFSLTGARYV